MPAIQTVNSAPATFPIFRTSGCRVTPALDLCTVTKHLNPRWRFVPRLDIFSATVHRGKDTVVASRRHLISVTSSSARRKFSPFLTSQLLNGARVLGVRFLIPDARNVSRSGIRRPGNPSHAPPQAASPRKTNTPMYKHTEVVTSP